MFEMNWSAQKFELHSRMHLKRTLSKKKQLLLTSILKLICNKLYYSKIFIAIETTS